MYLCRIPLCAADRSIPAVESIAGDEAAAAELDRLARLMEQQAILEKVHRRHKISPFLTERGGGGPVINQYARDGQGLKDPCTHVAGVGRGGGGSTSCTRESYS